MLLFTKPLVRVTRSTTHDIVLRWDIHIEDKYRVTSKVRPNDLQEASVTFSLIFDIENFVKCIDSMKKQNLVLRHNKW